MLSKKFFLIVLAVAVVAVLGSGCALRQSDENKIVIWHWMADRQDAFEALADEYKAETGITIQFESFFPPDVYMQKIYAAAAANDLPDLFGILQSKKILGDFIKVGNVENLSPAMEAGNKEWEKRFIDITLAVNTFEPENIYEVDPGIYAVPIDTMSMQFLCNTGLYEKAGFDPKRLPNTWQEFLNAARTAREKLDVEGFVCGWGETWLIYSAAVNYAFNIMGEEKFFATLRGEVSYDDPDWITVFSLFKEMADSKILFPGMVTMNNKEAEQFFATEQALFSYNGTWGINTYRQINPDLKYTTMLPPAASSDYPIKILAGAGSSFMVNPHSAMKQKAIDFLNWLTGKEQQLKLMKETNNLPSYKLPLREIPENLAVFLNNIDKATHQNLWPLNEDPRVIDEINLGIQEILIGKKTPQQVAEAVAKVKQSVK